MATRKTTAKVGSPLTLEGKHMAQTVVIAWTENDGMEPTGKMERFDGYNYRPTFKAVEKARAAVWVRKASSADIENARRHVAGLTDAVRKGVFTYPSTERDPIGKAKAAVMQAV